MEDPPSRPRLSDVARLAGTSTAVVSYVINDGPRPVASATRERVLAAIASIGYRPNRAARALRSNRRQFIGLVVPATSNPHAAQLAQAVEQAALRRGLLTLTGSSGFSADQEAALLRGLIEEGVAGIVIAGLGRSEHLQSLLDVAPARAVFIHNRPPGVHGPAVKVDNAGWARRATEHLLEHGYDEVALLTHDDDEGPVGERAAGWRRAVEGNRGEPRVIRSGYDRGAASRAVQAALEGPRPPRALFAATDELAIGALHAAGRVGVAVPERLAVMGFDGVYESATTVPELSTVAEPFAEMGERALALLLDDPAESDTDLPCTLVLRRSCGCGHD